MREAAFKGARVDADHPYVAAPQQTAQPGMPSPRQRSFRELTSVGALIPELERCIADRIAPGRSGWSAAHHLRADLRRHHGIHAPAEAVDEALRVLRRRRRVHLRLDADGVLWYHRRP